MARISQILLALAMFALTAAAALGQTPRETLAKAVLSEDAAEQIDLVSGLAGVQDDTVMRALEAWRVSELFIVDQADGTKVAVLLDPAKDADGNQKAVGLADGKMLKDEEGKDLAFSAFEVVAADTTSKLRKAIKMVLDLNALDNPNPKMRRDAITKLGQERVMEYLPHFEGRMGKESDPEVAGALVEAVALTKTSSEDQAVRLKAVRQLGEIRSLNGLQFLIELKKEAAANPVGVSAEFKRALEKSVHDIELHMWWGNMVGTAFRGLAAAAVLLVAALGLAITFGLMGVINMAHGEIIMVGAYAAYVTQNLFRKLSGGMASDWYFPAAIVVAFVAAGLAGLLLERGVIRFLYKRPLESLLATWGVSLVLQQVFRHVFGAANVQVDSPALLSGSFAFNGAPIGYNRIFLISFAVFIVLGTYLLLTRTSLGLQIRAVMQNRTMAACVGVGTDKVNMMTFALGSGLAGVAGACLSQIGNVGPSLGQNYIVDCFMIVVLGGVGSIVGTVAASLGVGTVNQLLEPWLGAVLGKIVVLTGIILFLQWRPSGLFSTRSRSLDG